MEISTKELIDKIDSRASREEVDSLQKAVTTFEARLADFKPDPEPDTDSNTDPEATLERAGFLDQIMKFELGGIPVGQAVVGGFVAIFASELVDGFLSNWQPWQRGLAKLGAAFVAGMWGKRLLGNTGAAAVVLLLTFDAVRDFTPIDSWADQLAERVTGTVTTAGLAGAQTGGRPINQPTNRGTGGASFYSQALGGGQ